MILWLGSSCKVTFWLLQIGDGAPVALSPEQRAAEDAGVAAVMAILGSDDVCEAVGMLGHLPRIAEIDQLRRSRKKSSHLPWHR